MSAISTGPSNARRAGISLAILTSDVLYQTIPFQVRLYPNSRELQLSLDEFTDRKMLADPRLLSQQSSSTPESLVPASLREPRPTVTRRGRRQLSLVF